MLSVNPSHGGILGGCKNSKSTTIINGKEVTVDRIEDLVATLNDLFGKFDDAADVRRIIIFFHLLSSMIFTET